MCFDAPEAPDPDKTSSAQFNYNTGASAASGIINNPNIKNQYGTTNYTQAGTEKITLPNGQTVQVPRYTQTTTQAPEYKKQTDNRNDIINQLFGQTKDAINTDPTKGTPDWQTGYKSGTLKTDFTAGKPTLGFTGIDTNQQMYNGKPGTQGFDPTYTGKDLQTSYAPEDGFSSDRHRVEEAVMSRGGELLGKNRDSEVARLAAMGLAPGGAKYGRVADQFERSGNDLAMQAVLAGGTEQSRMLGEARAEGEFGNAAKGQGYGMDMGLTKAENDRRMGEAGFARDTVGQNNAARASEAQMTMARTEMENARRRGDAVAYNAAKQAYNQATMAQTGMNKDKAGFSNNVRNQQVAESLGISGSKFNQLMGMLSGTQMTNPNAPSYQGQSVGSPDYMGAVNNNYNQAVGQYNNQMTGYMDLAKTGVGFLPI